MRAIYQYGSGQCHFEATHPVRPRRTPLSVVCATQQSSNSSVAPQTLADVLNQYRGLVGAPKKKQKASDSSRSSQGPASNKPTKPPKGGPDSEQEPTRHSKQTATGRTVQQKGQLKSQSSKATSGKAGPRSQSSSSSTTKGQQRASSKDKQQRKAGDTSSNKDADKAPSAPPRIPQGSLLPSNGKGFGSIVSSSKQLKKSNNASSRDQASSGSNSSNGNNGNSSSGGKVLRLFRFGCEAAAVQRAAEACGWTDRIMQVDSLGQADILIAVKDTAGGKHQNLQQGERAAKNAGIPFVVVGRRMTKDSLQAALGPYLNPTTPAQAAAQAEQQRKKEAENKAVADAWFSAATSARFGSRIPTSSVLQKQQQRQQVKQQLQQQ